MNPITSAINSGSDPHRAHPRRDRAGRPPEKRLQVEAFIRNRIIRGKLQPGDRLPTQAALTKTLGVTNQTVLEAVDALANDGYIRTDGRRGSFVCSHPPHLARFALLFSVESPPPDAELTVWQAMLNEIERLNRLHGDACQIVPFFNINGHRDEPEYRRLIEELDRHRFAGLLFASSPHLCIGDRRLMSARLPRSAFMTERFFPDIPIINIDIESFWRRATQYLIEKNRRKVAVILPLPVYAHHQDSGGLEQQYLQIVRSQGVQLLPWHVISIPQMAGQTVAHFVQLMSHLPLEKRPDALIVADDSHLRGVIEGLKLAHWTGDHQPLIVSHANHPAPAVDLPVTRLGYDIRTAIHLLLHQVRTQIHHQTFEPQSDCPALFTHEIDSAWKQISQQFPLPDLVSA